MSHARQDLFAAVPIGENLPSGLATILQFTALNASVQNFIVSLDGV